MSATVQLFDKRDYSDSTPLSLNIFKIDEISKQFEDELTGDILFGQLKMTAKNFNGELDTFRYLHSEMTDVIVDDSGSPMMGSIEPEGTIYKITTKKGDGIKYKIDDISFVPPADINSLPFEDGYFFLKYSNSFYAWSEWVTNVDKFETSRWLTIEKPIYKFVKLSIPEYSFDYYGYIEISNNTTDISFDDEKRTVDFTVHPIEQLIYSILDSIDVSKLFDELKDYQIRLRRNNYYVYGTDDHPLYSNYFDDPFPYDDENPSYGAYWVLSALKLSDFFVVVFDLTGFSFVYDSEIENLAFSYFPKDWVCYFSGVHSDYLLLPEISAMSAKDILIKSVAVLGGDFTFENNSFKIVKKTGQTPVNLVLKDLNRSLTASKRYTDFDRSAILQAFPSILGITGSLDSDNRITFEVLGYPFVDHYLTFFKYQTKSGKETWWNLDYAEVLTDNYPNYQDLNELFTVTAQGLVMTLRGKFNYKSDTETVEREYVIQSASYSEENDETKLVCRGREL